MKKAEGAILYAPVAFHTAPREAVEAVCNGCGAKGWKVDLVPDNLLGVSISAACDIHDWMYYVGEDIRDKDEADRVFLNNMLRLIEARGGWAILRKARRWMAWRYYEAVDCYGGPAFWNDKNDADTNHWVPGE